MKVVIDPIEHEKIKYLVDKSNVEISGLGRAKWCDKIMGYRVTKTYLLEQENGPASTDIDPNAVAKLMYESKDDDGYLNFWWHSHVNMGVFWSGTDMDTMRQFAGHGMVVATVFNKKGETRSAYMQCADDQNFRGGVFVDNIPYEVERADVSQYTAQWEKEFTDKCKPKTWAPPTTGGSNWYKGKNKAKEGKTKDTTLLTTTKSITEVAGGGSTSKEDIIDGAICPYDWRLRWCEWTLKYIPYSEWHVLNQYDENLLDDPKSGTTRVEWIRKFKESYGFLPTCDEDVDDFYIKSNDLTFYQFYI